MPYQSKVMLFGKSCSKKSLCKITEPRKQKLKIEIFHDLKEFENIFFKFFSIIVKIEICLIFKNSLLQDNLALKCKIV